MIAFGKPRRGAAAARLEIRPRAWQVLAALSLLGRSALAQQAPEAPEAQEPPAAPSLPDAPADDAAPSATEETNAERIAELTARIERGEQERQRSVPRLSWNGYVDFGYFAPIGNGGVGWIRDAGNAVYPQYANYSWVFLGDILATAVNTRGEVASLGNAPGVDRFDSVASAGAGGFIVNEINLRPRYQLADNAIMRASINFVPRTGSDFALGDFIEADQAELEYMPTSDGKTSIFVGKTFGVFGIEYKERRSDERFGITPSLVGRYTDGPILGVKVRSKLLNDWLILAGSVSNGSTTTEQFHFYSEIDQNWGKTLAGRAAINIPVGRLLRNDDRIEIGISGEWGPQDRATDDNGKIWFEGIDLQYLNANFAFKAQIMRGGAPGEADAAQNVYGLQLHPSGYAELDWQILPQFGFLLRGALRDAIVTLGSPALSTSETRIYITKEIQYTVGARVVFNPHIVAKLEYNHNQEYGGVPSFLDDIFTSSMVLSF
ncbi:MAG TPA: hypothetical protein VKZ18_04645 [Polyangia bacterium]|nr:hypothetical protein [Polyangia bacterium]